jgi:hypothetical protein
MSQVDLQMRANKTKTKLKQMFKSIDESKSLHS